MEIRTIGVAPFLHTSSLVTKTKMIKLAKKMAVCSLKNHKFNYNILYSIIYYHIITNSTNVLFNKRHVIKYQSTLPQSLNEKQKNKIPLLDILTLWSKLGEELMGYQNANRGVYGKVNYISMM